MRTIHLKAMYPEGETKLASLEVYFEDAGDGFVRARYRINGKAKVTTRYDDLAAAYADWDANIRSALGVEGDEPPAP